MDAPSCRRRLVAVLRSRTQVESLNPVSGSQLEVPPSTLRSDAMPPGQDFGTVCSGLAFSGELHRSVSLKKQLAT